MNPYPHNPTPDYAARVEALEAEGMTTSDAQAVVDAEITWENRVEISTIHGDNHTTIKLVEKNYLGETLTIFEITKERLLQILKEHNP